MQSYNNHTCLRSAPAVWSKLHTCQVSCLHLHRLQRCRANANLPTRRNKQTRKRHLPKYAQPYTRHVSRTIFLVYELSQKYTLNTILAFTIVAGNQCCLYALLHVLIMSSAYCGCRSYDPRWLVGLPMGLPH